MSMENARAFYMRMMTDTNLQDTISRLAKENPLEIGAIILKTAKENGFEFNEDEMKAFIAEETKKTAGRELNDNELEAVAGGSKAGWIAVSIIFAPGCAGSALGRLMDSCEMDTY